MLVRAAVAVASFLQLRMFHPRCYHVTLPDGTSLE
jgi:hypothetical protein